jgi:hypothetical protein
MSVDIAELRKHEQARHTPDILVSVGARLALLNAIPAQGRCETTQGGKK